HEEAAYERRRALCPERSDARDGLGDDLRARTEVQTHVPCALRAECRAVVQRDLCFAEDPLRRIVTPAEVGEIDPGEISGIRDPIACARKVRGKQIRDKSAVLIERCEQSVQPG